MKTKEVTSYALFVAPILAWGEFLRGGGGSPPFLPVKNAGKGDMNGKIDNTPLYTSIFLQKELNWKA